MPADDPREPSAASTARSDRERRRPAVGRVRRAPWLGRVLGGPPIRGRTVRRTIRHIEPWSVLRIALLFHAAVFLIVCVASALLWTAARASGTLDNVESFVTSVGGFGNCEPIDGRVATTTTTTTTEPPDDEVDQLGPGRTTEPEGDEADVVEEDDEPFVPDDDEDCGEGRELVGEFRFEDGRIFQAFAFGGVVLVLAGTGATVVLVLLFNLMSDVTGGVQMTVVEEDGRSRRPVDPGSPPSRRRG
jgi:hypothetical protein